MGGLKIEKTSIVMPCLNEEAGLRRVLPLIPDFVYETIVVNNCSTDKNEQVANSFGARVIRENKLGYGNALLTGLACARGDIIVIMDSDGAHSPGVINGMLQFMVKNNLDFISGCRFPLSSRGIMPEINIISNHFISWLAHRIFGIEIIDLQSGMMVFRKNIMQEVKVFNSGMGFSQEMKIRCWKNKNIKCAEMHISLDRRIGKAKFRKMQDNFNNLRDLFHLRREFIEGHI